MLSSDVLQRLEQVLRGLVYGSVQLVVHDAQIVRIERVERCRLTVSTEAASFTDGRPTKSSEVAP